MILPDKHIKLSESIFGLAGVILAELRHPDYIEELWGKFERINNTERMPTNHSYDNFLIALDYLYMIGAIDADEENKLYICN